MNTNFKVIGLTPLEIKPKFTAPEADAIITQPSEGLNDNIIKYTDRTIDYITSRGAPSIFQGDSKKNRSHTWEQIPKMLVGG